MIRDAGVMRATERVKLACRALSAASHDLFLAVRVEGVALDETAQALNVEVERVCELAERLEECVAGLESFAGAAR